jgi:hypothetical protein
MTTDWQAFLDSRDTKAPHGDLISQRFISPLHADGLLLVSGEEATDFLQGQLCNDLRRVDQQHSQLSGYCTPKGRLLALARVLQREEGYLLRLPREVLQSTQQRLQMFIMRAKVTLQDASDSIACFGIAGADASELLAQFVDAAPPQESDSAIQQGELTLVRVAGDVPRYEIYGPVSQLGALWEQIAAHDYLQLTAQAWQQADILAGLPNVYPETREAFIPQMLNLQQINGLSFTKGCYPGQEIVARSQYLGELKRRMYRLDLQASSCPTPSAEIVTGDGAVAGSVVDAAGNGERCVLLAVLRKALADSPLALAEAPEAALNVIELPYGLPD